MDDDAQPRYSRPTMDLMPKGEYRKMTAMWQTVLDRYCRRMLHEVVKAATAPEVGDHGRFLDVINLVDEKYDEMRHTFDNIRKSDGVYRLSVWRRNALLTDDEYATFSDATRAEVERMVSISPRPERSR